MANNKFAGTVYVKVDGRQMALAGSLTVSPAKVEREGKAGLSGVVGYIERPRVPFIEGEFNTVPGFDAKRLEDVTDETVTAELAYGATFILRNAWLKDAIEINAAEGTFTARFEGMDCSEL